MAERQVTENQASDTPNPAAFDSDVPLQTTDFTTAEVDILASGGQATLFLPQTGELRLQAIDLRTTHGTEFMTLHTRSDVTDPDAAMPSVLTRRGDAFFLTLATPRGSYRIEGNATGSRVVSHQLLAQRQVSHADDFRFTPAQ